jgi:lipoprotein-releasing system ATP-binding protein
VLKVESLSKRFDTPRGPLSVLSDVSFELEPGQGMSIVGPSGSGKSTLLYILGTLESPSDGRVSLGGRDPFAMGELELARFRNSEIGFVFQDHCLLPQLTVLENVLAPTLVSRPHQEREQRARELLGRVGLGERLDHLPAQLSGGEKQRTALARALILDPALLLCDEPTGNLDRRSAESVGELLLEVHREQQTILIVVTHSEALAARFPERRRLSGEALEPVPGS